MPISPIVIQRRHAELGRIRLGHKVGGNGRPAKLAAFRFTSPQQRYIADLAELYGGTPQPWDNSGKPEFEVFSEATSIPVLVVKGGLSQWMETWSGGGCTHRCDGEQQVDGTLCDPQDPKHQQSKPYTRLSVMLPELEAVGVFRMESHGWNAAAEIPAVAELAQYVGPLVPAHLNLTERRVVKDGQTSRFVVPILDLEIGATRLRELAEAMSEGRELGPSATVPELASVDPFVAYRTRVEEAETLKELGDVWTDAVAAGLVGAKVAVTPAVEGFTAVFRARAAVIQGQAALGGQPGSGGNVGEEVGAGGSPASDAASSPTPDPTPDAEGVVEAELVSDNEPEPDPDAVWQQVVGQAGRLGMTTADLEADVSTFLGGTTSAEASGAELQAYLDDLTKRNAA